MDEAKKLREVPGPSSAGYDDVQLQELSRELDFIAKFLLDLYAFRRSSTEKSPHFDTDRREP
jgi:hypothetical protein